MKSLLTDENNDIYLKNFGLAFGEDKEAVAQIVTNVLRLQQGELQYDTDKGIPYLETVLGDNPDVQVWSSYMIDAIKGIEYVEQVDAFNVKIEGDTLKYGAKISTIYGEVTTNG